jgi:multicomponent Na+:H+ antiporter subunit G
MDWIAAGCLLLGGFFFLAGTLGLLRFPDVYSRLHALTKADNVGLGLVVLGLSLHSGSLAAMAKMLLIWLLVLVASSSVAHLVARDSLRRGEKPWTKSG